MKKKRVAVKFDPYAVVEDAVEEGLQFALNRLEDVHPLPDGVRNAVFDRMLGEIMVYLGEVLDLDDAEQD